MNKDIYASHLISCCLRVNLKCTNFVSRHNFLLNLSHLDVQLAVLALCVCHFNRCKLVIRYSPKGNPFFFIFHNNHVILTAYRFQMKTTRIYSSYSRRLERRHLHDSNITPHDLRNINPEFHYEFL